MFSINLAPHTWSHVSPGNQTPDPSPFTHTVPALSNNKLIVFSIWQIPVHVTDSSTSAMPQRFCKLLETDRKQLGTFVSEREQQQSESSFLKCCLSLTYG